MQDVIGQGEVLSSEVILPPQLYLVVWVHLMGLPEQVLFGRREVTGAQPGLMDDFRDKVWSLLKLYGHEIIPRIKYYNFRERYFVLKYSPQSFFHPLAVNPGSGLPELLKTYFFKRGGNYGNFRINDYLGCWDVPYLRVLASYEFHPRICKLPLGQLQKGYQEDDSILEVLPEEIPQIELRDVPETFNGKYSQMVEDRVHFLYVGAYDAFLDSAEGEGRRRRVDGGVGELERKKGHAYISGSDSFGYIRECHRRVESLACVHEDGIRFGVALFDGCMLNIMDLVLPGPEQFNLIPKRPCRLMHWDNQEPILKCLIRQTIQLFSDGFFLHFLKHNDAQLYLPLREGVEEDLPIFGNIENLVHQTFLADITHIPTTYYQVQVAQHVPPQPAQRYTVQLSHLHLLSLSLLQKQSQGFTYICLLQRQHELPLEKLNPHTLRLQLLLPPPIDCYIDGLFEGIRQPKGIVAPPPRDELNVLVLCYGSKYEEINAYLEGLPHELAVRPYSRHSLIEIKSKHSIKLFFWHKHFHRLRLTMIELPPFLFSSYLKYFLQPLHIAVNHKEIKFAEQQSSMFHQKSQFKQSTHPLIQLDIMHSLCYFYSCFLGQPVVTVPGVGVPHLITPLYSLVDIVVYEHL